MINRYIYKLYFKNGCTYVGKHSQSHSNDNYITSSSYYKKHKDLLERREILIDRLPDVDTMDIMESLCIMADICENPLNVNYNRGAWLDPSKFDRGYSGPANGMYGRKMKDIMGEEAYKKLVERQAATRKANLQKKIANGLILVRDKKAKQKEYNSKLREINRQIKQAHKEHNKYIRSLPKRWYYNPITLQETYWYEQPGIDWKRGRLPYKYWSEERKQSYAAKHTKNPFADWSVERMEEYAQKQAERQKGKIGYTNGKNNIYLYQGQDIPDGYYRGCTFTKTELYIATRKKKGYNNKGEKVNG